MQSKGKKEGWEVVETKTSCIQFIELVNDKGARVIKGHKILTKRMVQYKCINDSERLVAKWKWQSKKVKHANYMIHTTCHSRLLVFILASRKEWRIRAKAEER